MCVILVLVENGWWNESGFVGMRDNGRAKQMRHKALVDMPITDKMNGPCDVVGFGFGGCEMSGFVVKQSCNVLLRNIMPSCVLVLIINRP